MHTVILMSVHLAVETPVQTSLKKKLNFAQRFLVNMRNNKNVYDCVAEYKFMLTFV